MINIHASLFVWIFFVFCPNFHKLIWNLKKAFNYFVELLETNPLIYNTLQFDKYSRLAILLINFYFLAENSKTNLKFEKSFHYFLELFETNSHIAIWSIFTSQYSFEYFSVFLQNFWFLAKISKTNLKITKGFLLVS